MSAPVKGAARAVCDAVDGIVLATVEIGASPERVFRALTDANEVGTWRGSDRGRRTTVHTADVRIGGAWRSESKSADGHAVSLGGQFIEIDAPRKIALTWHSDEDAGQVTTLAYRLEPTERGVRLTLRHHGFEGRPNACRDQAEEWERALGALAALAGAGQGSGAPPSAFMCRLIPPRPTFGADMSDDERAMMMRHVAYWTQKLAEGRAIVFGPVADPKGGWGLGVVLAANLDEVKAFEAQDPAILSGRGFRYEILPMLRAVY